MHVCHAMFWHMLTHCDYLFAKNVYIVKYILWSNGHGFCHNPTLGRLIYFIVFSYIHWYVHVERSNNCSYFV